MANVIFFVKTLILQNNATNRQNGCKIIVKNLENPYNTRILTIFKAASFLSTCLKEKRDTFWNPFFLSSGDGVFEFEPVPCALRNGMPMHIPHSEIDKPACRAESAGIFAAGEYRAVYLAVGIFVLEMAMHHLTYVRFYDIIATKRRWKYVSDKKGSLENHYPGIVLFCNRKFFYSIGSKINYFRC
ncbi:MAG: hypothetical protein E7676_07350 [Ruminococcaceae bacterium]|nr:hypothetical protein [Oscillospiraceae bacterium]